MMLTKALVRLAVHRKHLNSCRQYSVKKVVASPVSIRNDSKAIPPATLNHLDDYTPFVSISKVKTFLLQKDITFSEGHTCISINCPICNFPNSCLFINKISGFFICNNCKKSGNWQLLELFFNNQQGELLVDECISYGQTIWNNLLPQTVPVDHKAIPEPFLKLKNINLLLSNLKELGVRSNRDRNELYFPLKHGDDYVGHITLKSDLSEETVPFKWAKGILSSHKKSSSAIVVAGLTDFITLNSLSLGEDVICLPHGQQALPQEILPLFEEYEKLIIWFDNDSISWGNSKAFTKKFFEGRCSLIQPTDNQPSPYNCALSGKDISGIIKNAQEISHSSIITFASLREDVLSELCNADKVSGVKWTRFPALNNILKGHRRGELTIITGSTGSGKTTFMSEYSLDLACSKVTTLWGSFEIRNQRLAKTMMTQMFSASLEKNLDKFNEWADKFERLPLYFMTFHGQQPLHTVINAVEHATYVHDVVHVIIDNVQFMLGITNNDNNFLDRFYRQDALIASFRNFATTRNCHVTLVIHPRKERDEEQLSANSIFGGAKAAQEADNILIIQHKMNQQTLRIKKFLQVAKNRFSGDLGIMPLEFDKERLSFSQKLSS